MRLRLLLGTLALAFASPVWATGTYDGVYQIPGYQEYYSVHQNGSGVLVALFFTNPQNIIYYTLNNGQTYVPPRLDNWDLFSGQMTGGSAVVVGESAFGACKVTLQFQLASTQPTVSVLGMTPTTSGAAQGINCSSVYAALIARIGQTSRLFKAY